jgi:hypothetical protein
MSKKGGKGTPDELDYLFERDIIDEEDYVSFWKSYWKLDMEGNKQGQLELINDYTEIAELARQDMTPEEQEELPRIAGVVTTNISDAREQARIISGIVVRRDKRGRFSKRGRRYQAVKKGGRKK